MRKDKETGSRGRNGREEKPEQQSGQTEKNSQRGGN